MCFSFLADTTLGEAGFRPYMPIQLVSQQYFQEVFTECYQDARKQASDETGLSLDTFGVDSPFTADECLDEDFLPD